MTTLKSTVASFRSTWFPHPHEVQPVRTIFLQNMCNVGAERKFDTYFFLISFLPFFLFKKKIWFGARKSKHRPLIKTMVAEYMPFVQQLAHAQPGGTFSPILASH